MKREKQVTVRVTAAMTEADFKAEQERVWKAGDRVTEMVVEPDASVDDWMGICTRVVSLDDGTCGYDESSVWMGDYGRVAIVRLKRMEQA